jgi:hypothetical protein
MRETVGATTARDMNRRQTKMSEQPELRLPHQRYEPRGAALTAEDHSERLMAFNELEDGTERTVL